MKYIISILLLFICVSLGAQNYERKGNTFTQTSSRPSSSSVKKTEYQWVDSKGKVYPVYITSNGRCFIFKVSAKTNNEYKYYLPEELSRDICKELNIKYKEKQQ